jgi:hypothetical protein
MVACSGFCLILHQWGFYLASSIIGSLAFGTSCSAVFPLLLAVPSEFGLIFKKEQMSNLMFLPFLSSSFITGVAGKLMSQDVAMLFLWLLVIGASLCANSIVVIKRLESEKSIPNKKQTY